MARSLIDVRVDALIPYARNARTHSDEQIAQIAASIKEFGFRNPVLIDGQNGIVAGHGRVSAARKLGLKTVPCIDCSDMTEAQKRAYVIADNQIALKAGWDLEMLSLELGDLDDMGIDLALLGFDEKELNALLTDKSEQEGEDETPELDEENVVSVHGDVWILGDHRLMCGDSTSADDVAKLLGKVKPHLMVTDPPYGVEYDANWRNEADRKNGKPYGASAIGKVQNDDRADWSETYSLFPGDVAYVWHPPGATSVQFYNDLTESGFDVRMQIIWSKSHFPIGRGHYHVQHEPCQPAGTLVSKVIKEGRWTEHSLIENVPIESLELGDRVVSFGNAKIYRRGREITRIGKRDYDGNMHTIVASGRSTRATAEHQFTIRFDPSSSDKYIVYVMRRGSRWRVGISSLFNSRGFGLAVRLSQELGQEAWIVSAHDGLLSARVAEQVVSCVYGIPTTHWETENKPAVGDGVRTLEHIEQIYAQIGVDRLLSGVERLFTDRGLSIDYPIIRMDEVGRFSRTQSRIVRACNLIPSIMQVPIPTNGEDFEWASVAEVSFSRFVGEVYSMDVDQDHHYVADGIVTHNCWYAVRKGSSGHWAGDRKQTTIWNIDKPVKSETGHSTQKPVECMRRPIVNNSSPGQAVYEPFSGSGTTIIAAETTGRCCYAMELHPPYVDMAVRRWQEFTGKKAIREADGVEFDALAPDESKAA